MKLSVILLAVAEPTFPPACEVLTARLAAPGGALSDAASQAECEARA